MHSDVLFRQDDMNVFVWSSIRMCLTSLSCRAALVRLELFGVFSVRVHITGVDILCPLVFTSLYAIRTCGTDNEPVGEAL